MAEPATIRPRAVVFGCAGPLLDDSERAFFGEVDPLGFILFERNCQTPDQVRALIGDLRAAVGRADAPVLIDQEGGRVQRLKPPHWRAAPAAGVFGRLAETDLAGAAEAVRLNARLIADELRTLGITHDCAPVLDVPAPGAHDIIGDRAFAERRDLVAALGREACAGFAEGGVLPIVKHIPGHGRAAVDSHADLPIVSAPLEDLEVVDFAPFRELSGVPWAMTAHVVYEALDAERPATTSPKVITEVIRSLIGFDGVLISDDIGMRALSGGIGERAAMARAAGCDVALHCSGVLAEMKDVASNVGPLTNAAEDRLERVEAMRRAAGDDDTWNPEAARARLSELLEAAA